MTTFVLFCGWLLIGTVLAVFLYFAWMLLIAPVLYVLCIYAFHWPGFIPGKPVTLRGIGRDLLRDYVDALDYRAPWRRVLRLTDEGRGE